MSEVEHELDWIYLPAGSEVQSLWESLHDGEILSCKSDLIERTIILECRVEHLLGEEHEDVSFLLKVEEVSSARANVWVRWLGEFRVPEGVSREEESRLIEEYQAKWREESLGWLEFESALANDPLQIREAELARSDGRVTLKVCGYLDGDKFDDQYCAIFLRGRALSASRSDAQEFDFEQFVALGERYWKAFSDRREQEDRSSPAEST